jgi:hypothetical protein
MRRFPRRTFVETSQAAGAGLALAGADLFAGQRPEPALRSRFPDLKRHFVLEYYPWAKRGFFLVYLNSFNEWHEGHQFEPMKDAGELTPAERARAYHNPDDGGQGLKLLGNSSPQSLNRVRLARDQEVRT